MSTEFKKYPKVDFHAHYLPQAYLDGMMECFGGNPDRFPRPEWSPEIHLAFNKELGIVYSLISISSPHLGFFGTPEYNKKLARLCNDQGNDIVKAHPDSFGIMASLPLPDVAAALEEIAYCCDTLKCVGFTLPTNTKGKYISDPEFTPVWEELDKRGALVTFHPNKPTAVPEGVGETLPIPMMEFFFDTTRTITDLIIKGYVTKYSNIKFLLPHVGAMMPFIADRLESYKSVLIGTETVDADFDIKAILSKVLVDTAGSSGAKQIPAMRQIVPDTSFYYASDYPFTPTPVIIEQGEGIFNAEYMTPELREKYFHKNAETFLKRTLV